MECFWQLDNTKLFRVKTNKDNRGNCFIVSLIYAPITCVDTLSVLLEKTLVKRLVIFSSQRKSMNKLRIFISSVTDPWFNLATENWIFRDMDPAVKILFLWRNQETVVIGRYQNPWVECNLEQMERDNVLLARRQSGGGAVFHDLGNTNFTFLTGVDAYDKQVNNQVIINALSTFGIQAYASGRNDILVDDLGDGEGRKISGSAFKQTKDRAFHHGTLLINANLTKLSNYLNPPVKKLEAKGIKSVRARVANLENFAPQINHEHLSEAIIHSFCQHYGTKCEVEYLDYDFLKGISSLNEYYQSLKDWNWRFGETPAFSHHLEERFEWGGMDVHLDVLKGIIRDCKIYSDSLHPEMIEQIMQAFTQTNYNQQSIAQTITKLKHGLPMYEDYLDEFGNWLILQIK